MTIADAVTSAMNAYAKTGLTSARATDILTAAVREGKLEASSLAPVLGSMLPTASALDISFDKLAGTLAVLSKTGTDASEGSTQLQALMSAMLNTSPKVTKGLKAVGLSQKELRKIASGPGGLVGVMRTLEKAFDGNVESMRNVIPNVRAFRPVMNALAQSGEDVDKVLRNVTNSAGLTARAFRVAQNDPAFKWEKAKASMEAAFIRIGGFAAPLAEKLASGLNAGLDTFNNFVEKISAARTVEGKLDVVWKGIDSVRQGAQRLLGNAIAGVDWTKVWAKASGIAAGLQKQIERTNWSRVGRVIGENLADAVGKAASQTKKIAGKIAETLRTIKWEQLGRALGPGLATAIVTAFLTLLDPVFWVRNWDLALSVAIVAAGGPLARGAARLGGMFVKLGKDAALMAGVGLLNGFGRVGALTVTFFEKILPKIIRASVGAFGRAANFLFGGFVNRVKQWFEKHAILGFIVKVHGVQAAITVVRRMVDGVKGVFSDLGDWLVRQGRQWAVRFLEPFTHMPWKLGEPFRKAQKEILGHLNAISDDAKRTAEAIQDSFDRITIDIPDVGGKPDEGTRGPGPTRFAGRMHPSAVPPRVAAGSGGAGPAGGGGGGGGTGPTVDEDAAAKREEKRDKERERREARLAARRKRTQELEQKAAEAVRRAAENAKQAWQEAGTKARQSFGQLFQGPILSTLQSALQAGASVDPLLVLRDVQKQNAETRELLEGLRTIEKRGAPPSLLQNLREQGPQAASVVKSIAGAPDDVFNKIVKAFQGRQQLIKAEQLHIRANEVVVNAKAWGSGWKDHLLKRAGGGPVPGSGSTDSVPAMLTPGELVLNKRQQGGLAGALGLGGASATGLFGAIQKLAAGGDTVPAMLTPGEIVLNRKHQRGLSRVLGLGAMSPEKLFGEVQAFRSGGVISGRRQTGPSFLGGGSGS
ncbi:MAG: phage tail tape measure protein, partial [Thermoleophilia bacterium]|nr:phage tail tape measure protein [Thermoleophilia bacterium]